LYANLHFATASGGLQKLFENVYNSTDVSFNKLIMELAAYLLPEIHVTTL